MSIVSKSSIFQNSLYNYSMNKLERMTEHLKKHPKDYQTGISFLKERSRMFDKIKRDKQIEMKRKIALYKKGA